MSEISAGSRIRDVVALGERGQRLLREHGYDIGEGFVDNLSQYASLQDACRHGRLRDLEQLVALLNSDQELPG